MFCTSVRMNTEGRYSGILVHESIRDSPIGALVSIDSMNLQNKCPCWLVLQDRRALSVQLTLRHGRGVRKQRG